jgi:hypothetical protein
LLSLASLRNLTMSSLDGSPKERFHVVSFNF